MHYRSIADLNDAILVNLHKLPLDIDLVVGIPRSGLLAANLLCLAVNVPMTDVEGFLSGRILRTGITRKRITASRDPEEKKTVVVIDDSILSGDSMSNIRDILHESENKYNITYCAVYGVTEHDNLADVILEKVPLPRIFQWNIMHHSVLRKCCVDIDGVLCQDPTPEDNDDGPKYLRFIENAIPLLSPTETMGTLVTCRLEKYRSVTVRWLENKGIKFENLYMLDLPSKKDRVRMGGHGEYKAHIYKNTDAVLFIESEYQQARVIAEQSGKPVLCMATQHIIYPSMANLETIKNIPLRLRQKTIIYKYYLKVRVLKRFVKKILSVISRKKSEELSN